MNRAAKRHNDRILVSMNCPNCAHGVDLTWSRYLRSVSGRHVCPRCGQRFRLQITPAYLLLWLDIIAVAVFTWVGLHTVLVYGFGYAFADPAVAISLILFPALVWGTVFLFLNRRALNKLATKPA